MNYLKTRISTEGISTEGNHCKEIKIDRDNPVYSEGQQTIISKGLCKKNMQHIVIYSLRL